MEEEEVEEGGEEGRKVERRVEERECRGAMEGERRERGTR